MLNLKRLWLPGFAILLLQPLSLGVLLMDTIPLGVALVVKGLLFASIAWFVWRAVQLLREQRA